MCSSDLLLRKDEDVEELLCSISIIQPEFITEERDEWKNDEEVQTLIQNLKRDPSTFETFSWKNDSLWYKYHLYIYNNSKHKKNILLELHTSHLEGHSIFLKT